MAIDEGLAREILEKARKKGASDGDILIAEGEHFSGRVRLAQVEQITAAREQHLGLRLFFDKRNALTSTSDFSPDSLNRLVEETCDLARATAHDEYAGLPEIGIRQGLPNLDLFDPTIHRLSVKEQLDLALRAEAAAFATDPRITNSEGGEFVSRRSRIVYAHTGGFSGSYETSSFVLSVSTIAAQNGSMQRDHWYSMSRILDRLDSPETVGRTAAERTVRRMGARKVSTCQVPVVFDPETASSLLSNLFTTVSGYSIYKGASFLAGRLGERIGPESLTVIDDGTLPGGLGSKPFDGEGVQTRKTVVVDRGVLAHYLTDTYSGKKLKFPSTGNAGRGIGDPPSVSPTNFYLAPGPHSPEEIIRSIPSGLYVTELIGFGFNPVTGDYSRGAVGFWIENGELAYPVEEITIAGNLGEMLNGIERIGNDLKMTRKIVSPTLQIARMTIAGH